MKKPNSAAKSLNFNRAKKGLIFLTDKLTDSKRDFRPFIRSTDSLIDGQSIETANLCFIHFFTFYFSETIKQVYAPKDLVIYVL